MEKLLRKLTKRNFKLAIAGDILFAFSLGSILWISLVKYNYFILIAAFLLIVNYLMHNMIDWYNKKKTALKFHLVGYIGAILLTFVMGIQSPQLPFKFYILGLSILLFVPALSDILRK